MKTGPALIVFLLMVSLSCSSKPESPSDVRERAANATAELKRDTKAVAEGVREGWSRDKSVDINSASKEQLQSLPGITPKLADNIILHRPYAKTSELMEKHVMSKTEYDKVAGQLTVK